MFKHPLLYSLLLSAAMFAFAVRPLCADVAPKNLPFVYALQPEQTRRYEVTAYFDGNFPPFDQPGNPPIHILARMEYLAKAGAMQPDGLPVSFTIDKIDMELLSKEMPLGAKIDPNDVTPFPLDLAQAQAALDSKVVLRADGSIAKLLSAPSGLVRINIGFDLRKLFLMVMPIAFPSSPLMPGEQWKADSGVLGSASGAVSYFNSVKSLDEQKGLLSLDIAQTGLSQVTDTLDNGGSSTHDKSKITSLLNGSVSLKADIHYKAAPDGKSAKASIEKGYYLLIAKITRTPVKTAQNSAALKNVPVSSGTGAVNVKARIVVRPAAEGKA